jgi:hypothetical protein
VTRVALAGTAQLDDGDLIMVIASPESRGAALQGGKSWHGAAGASGQRHACVQGEMNENVPERTRGFASPGLFPDPPGLLAVRAVLHDQGVGVVSGEVAAAAADTVGHKSAHVAVRAIRRAVSWTGRSP